MPATYYKGAGKIIIHSFLKTYIRLEGWDFAWVFKKIGTHWSDEFVNPGGENPRFSAQRAWDTNKRWGSFLPWNVQTTFVCWSEQMFSFCKTTPFRNTWVNTWMQIFSHKLSLSTWKLRMIHAKYMFKKAVTIPPLTRLNRKRLNTAQYTPSLG